MLKAFKVNKSVFTDKTSTLNVLILLKITHFLANLQNLMHVKLAKILICQNLYSQKLRRLR